MTPTTIIKPSFICDRINRIMFGRWLAGIFITINPFPLRIWTIPPHNSPIFETYRVTRKNANLLQSIIQNTMQDVRAISFTLQGRLVQSSILYTKISFRMHEESG